jgi:predicted nucleic acid-binding protein
MARRFLDTNVVIRLLTRDDEGKARRALELMLRVARGEETVVTSQMVIFELVFLLEKTYKVARSKIRDDLKALLALQGLVLANKQTCQRSLDLYAETKVSFADAYNAAFMRGNRVSEIYSWDSDFDKLEGIARVTP